MKIWSRMPDSRLIIEVSLWSADFTRLADEIQRVDPYTDMYHIDVSDGHFVPGFLFFADLVAVLRPLTEKPFHVHLMTTQPQQHVADFAAAGADLISVHAENGPLAPAALAMVRNAGLATGLVLGLDVLVQSVVPYLDLVDMVLLMGTPMGVKGVEPSRYATQRISQMQDCIQLAGLEQKVKVFADGGIRTHTVPDLRKAGADGIIAGSLVFKSSNLQQTVDWLHSLQKKGPERG